MTTNPPNPSGLWSTELTGELPGLLADLESIVQDLEFARNALLKLGALPTPDQAGYDIVMDRALWNAAHVAYSRPFQTGKGFLRPRAARSRINAMVAALSESERKMHDALLETRNTHVAHAVSSREGVIVHADFLPPDQGGQLVGVGWIHHTHNSDRTQTGEMITTADRLLSQLALEVDKTSEALTKDCERRREALLAQASPITTVDVEQLRSSN